jgi:hypothetical protein
MPGIRYSIKIDLLVSWEGRVEIPSYLDSRYIESLNSLNVAPTCFVLYHKLVGWRSRLDSREDWKIDKAHDVDHDDILFLCDKMHALKFRPLVHCSRYMGSSLVEKFSKHASDFCFTYGRVATQKFRRIGFSIY